MLAFEQFVEDTLRRGGSINTMFEERLFALIGVLERVSIPLAEDGIPYELIGGGAVMVQVQRVEPSAVRNTKDVDIMIHREDLERAKESVKRHGFTLDGVRLILSGEKVRPNERVSIHGLAVAVIPVADLLQMKLSNNRDIDRVHVRDLDSVGLITAEVENSLPSSLAARLAEIRGTE